MSNSDLRRAWKVQQAQKQDVTNAIPALMGNGHSVVEVPNQPGYVYIRLGQGDLGQAFNNRCPLTDNLAIYVGYDPVLDPDRRIFQVLSVRMADYAGAGGTPTPNVGPHHLTHEYGGGDDVYISWRRLMGFRVGRPSGFQVTVDEGVIIRAGAWLSVAAQTLDLTALKPAAGLARYVLIALNAAGAATATAGAPVGVGVLDISNCPIPGASAIPLAAVRLYGAQTSIGDVPTAPDIVDLRFPQSMSTGDVHLEDLSDYARGRIIRGGAADWEAYSAKTAGFIVQGDGTDVKSDKFDWDVFSAGAGADMVHSHASDAEGGVLTVSSGAGGQEPFHVDGSLAVLSDVCDTFISPAAQSIDSVYIKCSTKGTASSTIVDVHRNGGTIFTTTANRPTLAFNGGDYAKSGTPNIVDLNEGDLVTFDIDQVATGAAKLSILLLLAAAISNVPQQGVLDASKIGAGTDNIVLALGGGGTFDSTKILHPCAVEWGGTVYLFYTGYDGATYKIGVATASVGGFTGVNFSKSGSNPILSPGGGGAWDANGVLDPWVIYDAQVGLWKMWYRGLDGSNHGSFGYATASSPTGTWTKSGSNPIMTHDVAWEGNQVLLPSILRESSTVYKMLYAGNEPFSADGRIGLATSTDGIAWTKSGSNPVLSPSGAGWMAASVFSPRTLVKVGSTYYLYFSAKPTAVGLSKSGGASSTDLITWTLNASNPLLSSTRAWEGGAAGETENPNFLRLGHDYYVFYDAYEGAPATIGVVKITA